MAVRLSEDRASRLREAGEEAIDIARSQEVAARDDVVANRLVAAVDRHQGDAWRDLRRARVVRAFLALFLFALLVTLFRFRRDWGGEGC
jgi:hypothetical protein